MQLALDLHGPPRSPDEDLVLRYVRRLIGPKTPTYVHRVETVVHDGRSVTADVRVSDGAVEKIEFSGDLKGCDFIHMRWHAGPGAVPFGFDDRLKRWRRYPDMVEPEVKAQAAVDRLCKAEMAKRKRRPTA